MVSQAVTLLLNSAAGGLRFLISLLIVIFLTPFIIQHVGAADFGLWNLVVAVLGFFDLLDLGFSNAVIKYVALYRGMGSPEKRDQALSTIFVVLLCLAAFGAGLVGLLSLVFNDWMSIPFDQQNKALALVWIIALRAIILGIPLGLYRGILFGEQKILLIQLISAICQLAYAMAAFLFLGAGYGILAIGWLTLFSFLLESLTYAFFAHHYWPDVQMRWDLVNREEFKEVAHFSTAQFFATFTSLIVLRADPLIVNYFFSLALVGIYAIALKVFTYAVIFIKQFLQVLTPYIASSKGAGETEKIHRVFIHFPKYAMFPASLITSAGCCFSYPLIVLWIGDSFSAAAPVLVILLLAFFISVPELVASDILAMTGLHVLMAKYSALSAIVNVFFSILLAASLGLNGVALGTVIGACMMLLIVRKVCKIYKVPFASYLMRVYGPAVIAGTAQGLVSLGMRAVIPIPNLVVLVFVSLPGCLINALIYWQFLDPDEKIWIKQGLRRLCNM